MTLPDPPATVAEEAPLARRPLLGHPVLDVRLGILRSDPTPHPYVCLEGSPLAWLSVEGCGTGSGFLYPSDGPDLAHFRARLRVAHLEAGAVDALAAVGAGIVEADRGPDDPGFRFSNARSADEVEGAGPELTAAAQSHLWVHPQAYLVADLTASVAYVAAAPVVLGTPGPVVVSAAFSVGVGF